MGALWAMALAQATAASGSVDLSKGPVTITSVAATVTLDGEGRVVGCKGAPNACTGFKRGRVVSAPLRRNGKPVSGVMSVSTTTVVSARSTR